MKLNQTFSILACGIVAFSSLPFSPSQAAPAKSTTVTSKPMMKSKGPDKNIKKDMKANTPGVKVTAPPSKGGPKSKGLYSSIHVDNRTGLYIKIYIDGDFEGTVGPYGDFYTSTVSGDTSLYARADYTDGSYSSWGPRTTYINGTFTWKLSN